MSEPHATKTSFPARPCCLVRLAPVLTSMGGAGFFNENMYFIHHCGTGKTLAHTSDKNTAVKLASDLMPKDSTFDTYISDTSKGYSRIIGFGSTGLIEETGDGSDPCTRGGSVLFGREHD